MTYVISYLLMQFYVNGDQIHYHKFFNLLSEVSLFDVPKLSIEIISSGEPIFGIVMWFGSYLGFSKNTFVSLLNVVLVYVLLKYLLKEKVKWYVLLLILTNFYLLVLFTAAERLKVAYIFLILGLNFYGSGRYLLFILASLSHFQTLLLLISILFGRFLGRSGIVNPCLYLRKDYIYSFLFILLLLLFLLFNYYFFIFGKFEWYFLNNLQKTDGNYDFSSMYKMCFFIFFGCLIVKKKVCFFYSIFMLMIVAGFIGDDRLNMIAFSVGMYYFILERKSSNPLVICMLLYFSIRSLFFIYDIYVYGNGFLIQ